MVVSVLLLALLLLSLRVSCSSYAGEWSAHTHAGRTYYYNKVTGKSQWEPPAGVSSKSAAPVSNANAFTAAQTRHNSVPRHNPMSAQHIAATAQTAVDATDTNHTALNAKSVASANSTATNAMAKPSIAAAVPINKYSNYPHRDVVNMLVQTEDKVSSLSATVEELRLAKEALQKRISNESALVQSLTTNLTAISEKKKEMLLKIDKYEADIINVNMLLDKERSEKHRLEEELTEIRCSLAARESALIVLQANFSRTSEELGAAQQLCEQQGGELSSALADIDRLEADLRALAVPSVKGLRSPSMLSKAASYSSWWRRFASYFVGGKEEVSAASQKVAELNSIVSALRRNLTAAAMALESKEDLVVELSEQIEEFEEEAEKRRRSYAALKQGIAALQSENRELEESVLARDAELLDVAVQLDREAEERIVEALQQRASLDFLNRTGHARQVVSSVLIAQLEGELEQKELELSRLESHALELRGDLEAKSAAFLEQRALNSDLGGECVKGEARLRKLELLLDDVRADLKDSRKMGEEKDALIAELRLQLDASSADEGVKDSFISHLKQKVADHSGFSKRQDEYIGSLQQELALLRARVEVLVREADTGDSLYRSIFGVL